MWISTTTQPIASPPVAASRGIRYSLVIPCYRSGLWLGELVARIAAVLVPRGQPFEVLLVNDASPDDTWETIERLAKAQDFVVGIDLLFRTGQFRATLCGFQHARGELIITLDDDLQHPPEEIPTLIEALESQPAWNCVAAEYAA